MTRPSLSTVAVWRAMGLPRPVVARQAPQIGWPQVSSGHRRVVDRVIDRIVDRVIDRIVDRVIDRIVDRVINRIVGRVFAVGRGRVDEEIGVFGLGADLLERRVIPTGGEREGEGEGEGRRDDVGLHEDLRWRTCVTNQLSSSRGRLDVALS
jgi:hypothetical protein